MVSPSPNSPKAAVETLLANPFLGGVFLGGSSDALLTDRRLRTLMTEGRWLVAADDEGGRVQRIDHLFGDMVSASEQARTMAPEAIESMARNRGAQLRGLGINVDFAPVVDLSDPAPGSVIGDRAYSSSAKTVTAYAGAFARGLRASSVLPTFKHFPGHGRASGDSHSTRVVTPPLADLAERDILPYRSLTSSAPSAVMVGHLDVPGLTEPDTPASLSPAVYRMLREEIGFTGLAVTDELAGMRAVSSRHSATAAAVLAVRAGADLVLVSRAEPAPLIDALVSAVDQGRLSRSRVLEAAWRVIATKSALGLGGCQG